MMKTSTSGNGDRRPSRPPVAVLRQPLAGRNWNASVYSSVRGVREALLVAQIVYWKCRHDAEVVHRAWSPAGIAAVLVVHLLERPSSIT
jgi:hypothetical protein